MSKSCQYIIYDGGLISFLTEKCNEPVIDVYETDCCLEHKCSEETCSNMKEKNSNYCDEHLRCEYPNCNKVSLFKYGNSCLEHMCLLSRKGYCESPKALGSDFCSKDLVILQSKVPIERVTSELKDICFEEDCKNRISNKYYCSEHCCINSDCDGDNDCEIHICDECKKKAPTKYLYCDDCFSKFYNIKDYCEVHNVIVNKDDRCEICCLNEVYDIPK